MAERKMATGNAPRVTDGQETLSGQNKYSPKIHGSQTYFKTLFGKLRTGTIAVCEIANGKLTPYFFDIKNVDAAAQKTESIKNHCYLTMGVLKERPEKGRGTADDVVGLPCFWADIDCREGVHNEKSLPTKEEAQQFISKLPLKPTMLIDSGGGFYPLWLFSEPLIFANKADRQEAAKLSQKWQELILQRAKAQGWNLDSTGDLIRLLRIPGTFNYKFDDPVTCQVVYENGARYTVDDFQSYLSKHEPLKKDVKTCGTYDIDSLPIKQSTKELIKNGVPVGQRSEAIMIVLNALVWSNINDAEIYAIFETYPIGEKFREKGQSRERWLQSQIDKARDRVTARAKQKEPGKPKADEDKPTKQPQAELLLEIAKGLDFYHDESGTVYANLPVDEHVEFTPINSRFFKDWLSNQYYKQKESIANSEAITAALRVLSGQGRYNSPEVIPYIRFAGHEGNIYLDLCNAKREVVEISKTGWRVVKKYPVFFRRPKGCLALPTPQPGGLISDLKRHLNVRDDGSWRLIVAWLVQAANPQGPYPILVVNGEQGTAKSSMSRQLRNLIDPNIAPLRSLPRSERDLAIACNNSWVQVVENISYIPDWLSDALCRLSTGGGFSTRTLYENDEETLFASKRPIILNGICNFVTRHDLADRAIMVNLDPIPDAKRLPESQLVTKFEKSAPYILGALLDAVSEALRNIETIKLERLPRMADFALWVSAAEPALPWEPCGFMKTYDAKRAETVRDAVEGSPLGAAVLRLMDDRDIWEGTPSDLLTQLESLTDEKTQRSKAWPGNVLWLGRRLVEISSFLRKVGIEITEDRDSKTRLLKITKNVVTLVTVVIDEENQTLTNDKKCDKKELYDKKQKNVVTDNCQLNQHVDKNDKNDKKKQSPCKPPEHEKKTIQYQPIMEF